MVTARPRVRIIATGGSISGVGPHRLDYLLYSESGRRLTIEQMVARVPEVHEIAEVRGEDLASVGSTSIGPQEWLQIAQRINQSFDEEPELSGVVVTHGTATLEETAYFLHLTVKSAKPVVVTGAMRPPTAVSTDADLNLFDAIRIAACPDAGGGVCLPFSTMKFIALAMSGRATPCASTPSRVITWGCWAMPTPMGRCGSIEA
jgi:L-asparaginase